MSTRSPKKQPRKLPSTKYSPPKTKTPSLGSLLKEGGGDLPPGVEAEGFGPQKLTAAQRRAEQKTYDDTQRAEAIARELAREPERPYIAAKTYEEALARHPHEWMIPVVHRITDEQARLLAADPTAQLSSTEPTREPVGCLACLQSYAAASTLPCPGRVFPDERPVHDEARARLPRDKRRQLAVDERRLAAERRKMDTLPVLADIASALVE